MATVSNTTYNSSKPKDKDYTISDGEGLHLLIKPILSIDDKIALLDDEIEQLK